MRGESPTARQPGMPDPEHVHVIFTATTLSQLPPGGSRAGLAKKLGWDVGWVLAACKRWGLGCTRKRGKELWQGSWDKEVEAGTWLVASVEAVRQGRELPAEPDWLKEARAAQLQVRGPGTHAAAVRWRDGLCAALVCTRPCTLPVPPLSRACCLPHAQVSHEAATAPALQPNFATAGAPAGPAATAPAQQPARRQVRGGHIWEFAFGAVARLPGRRE